MRKRLVRAVILIAIATGIAIGVADAAGAVELRRPLVASDGILGVNGPGTTPLDGRVVRETPDRLYRARSARSRRRA